MAKAPEMTTYLLEMKNGSQKKVTVPAHWKVTFGPLVPGSKGFEHNGESSLCMRFYSKANQQHAVFTGVKSFRDLSIKLEVEVTRTQQETFYKDTPEGKKSFVTEVNVKNWQDPDAPQDTQAVKEFAKLPIRDSERVVE